MTPTDEREQVIPKRKRKYLIHFFLNTLQTVLQLVF